MVLSRAGGRLMRDFRQKLRSKWVRNIALGLVLADGFGIYAANLRLNQPVVVDENFAVAEAHDTLAYAEPVDRAGPVFEPTAGLKAAGLKTAGLNTAGLKAAPMAPANSFGADQPADVGSALRVPAHRSAASDAIMVPATRIAPMPHIQQPNLTERPAALIHAALVSPAQGAAQSHVALVSPAQGSGLNAFPSSARHASAGIADAHKPSAHLATAFMEAVKTAHKAPAGMHAVKASAAVGVTAAHVRGAQHMDNHGGDRSPHSSPGFGNAFAPFDAATISGSAPPAALADDTTVTFAGQAGSSSQFQDDAVAAPQAHDGAQGAGSVAAAPTSTQYAPQGTARVEAVPAAPPAPADQALPAIVIPSVAFGQGS